MFDSIKYYNKYRMLNSFVNGHSPAIFGALKNGHDDVVEYLLERTETDPNIRNKDGETGLMVSIKMNSIEMVNLYIKNGANVNERSPNNSTALHLAVEYNDPKIVSILLENHASTEVINDNSETPLDIAKRNNNEEIIRLFNIYNTIRSISSQLIKSLASA